MSLLVQPQPQPRDVGGFSQENLFVGVGVGVGVSVLRGLCVEEEEEEVGSESSSSIGVGGESDDDDDDDGGEEEVESKSGKDSFESLDSLEDSLPIKRGLSNFFNGKSKSFASLSEAAETTTSASDLAKPENPFNKRRRIVMACKSSWKRRASCTSLLHPLKETQREEEEEEEEEGENEITPTRTCLDALRSPKMRCFSLCDLNRHDGCD